MNPTPLRRALYARLTGALAGVAVWTQVPQDTDFPYVRIGPLTASDNSTKSDELNDYEVQVHAFTRHKTIKGPEPMDALMNAIHAALHDQDAAITLTQGRIVFIRCTYVTSFQEEVDTGDLWHGVQRYRILTQDI